MSLIHCTDDDFKKTIEAKGKKIVVDFWAEWCSPCRMFGPVFEKAAEDYPGDDVIFCKVNVDEAKETAAEHEIMSIPTVALFENGRLVRQKVGVMNEKALHDFIKG